MHAGLRKVKGVGCGGSVYGGARTDGGDPGTDSWLRRWRERVGGEVSLCACGNCVGREKERKIKVRYSEMCGDLRFRF